MYTAIVLDQNSHSLLKNKLINQIPSDWNVYCHHMTVNLGLANGSNKEYLGKEFDLLVQKIGFSDKAIAVAVSSPIVTANKIPHITVAINSKIGGKPKHSNEIVNWQDITPFVLKGVLREQN